MNNTFHALSLILIFLLFILLILQGNTADSINTDLQLTKLEVTHIKSQLKLQQKSIDSLRNKESICPQLR
jgi:hypothetical protein